MNRKPTCFRAIVLIVISIFVAMLTSCSTEDSSVYSLPEHKTKNYTYHHLEIELTNVVSDRTETMTDDGGNEWNYTVITYLPGSKLTVIKADMSDSAYSEDAISYPQWGIHLHTSERMEVTDDIQPLDITPDMIGIVNLEASLYVFRFEAYKG